MSASRSAIHRMSFVSIVLVFVVILSTETQAEFYEFKLWEPITSNSSYEDEFAQGLSLVVTDEGVENWEVLFTFYNNSTIIETDTVGPGTITDIYFDDGSLLGISSILDDPPDVEFDYPANPGELPGWNNVDPPFDTSEDGHFSADADNAPSGVDPGEYVGIVFDLEGGKTFAHVIDAINLGFTYPSDASWYTNSLRIGVHVSNLGLDGGDYSDSDSFIMTPVPSAVLLGLLGLGVAGVKLRKFA